MLDRCSAKNIVQLDLPLYYYRSSRADGKTLATTTDGQFEQWLARHYVHHSAIHSLWYGVRFPRRTAVNLVEWARRKLGFEFVDTVADNCEQE
jgi:hypothetical protein